MLTKKFIQNPHNIPSISKTIQHTPMTWCTYLQSFEKKIQQCVFELQCENLSKNILYFFEKKTSHQYQKLYSTPP